MSLESDEMAFKGFRGVGTVCRENGENFIVIGRDDDALLNFWSRWKLDFEPDRDKYKKCIVVSELSLPPSPKTPKLARKKRK